MIDLTGKHAIVTGASRGIGAATARLLAKAGANVCVGFHTGKKQAEEVVQDIRREGRHALSIGADISKKEETERLVSSSESAFGQIDILVVNAGIWQRAAIDEMSEQQWQKTMDINLKSAYFLCHAVIPSMKDRRSGNVILVSSTAGQRGEAYYSHYAASKGALIALTKALASEVGPYGIRVNCVAPGWVQTDMTRDVFRDLQYREQVRQTIPLRRIAEPDDIAAPILFLASSLSGHIHGEVLNVNGGSVLCG